ncbi:phosphoribosylanthranilate isomerase [Streptomyces phaeolivaceus]|uniref:N-(5'-phosphoribosyl)anthranilate isomerase n=1 Tax=Streptomyces phaeolivaceus TaxID=2653200 RepID=A0A5P8KID9_9ACTN|nr:phosphoribosylanthranilate isomerase [Streptomyces phaeolivaceus]QFR02368.1 phosphoribosylanthranilate isomerase [Streptomyces phaeolivaceus]
MRQAGGVSNSSDSDLLFVKICGLRTEQDVDTAVEAGADAVGFVFSASPRRIDAALAARLSRRVPEHVLTVGVFREEPLADVRAVAAESGIRAIQLHGPDDRAYYDELASDDLTLIRAAAFGDAVPRCGDFGEDMLLLDAPVPGSGIAWDWASKPLVAAGEKWLLAGGLTPENVRDAVAATSPWGVDVSSGVEQRRGVKDHGLIREFVKAARAGR